MAITDIPILSMLRTRLQWAQERQRVLAENVANADTPNYRARDLAPPKFEAPAEAGTPPLTGVSLDAHRERSYRRQRRTSDSPFRSKTEGNFEVRPTGNAVESRSRK